MNRARGCLVCLLVATALCGTLYGTRRSWLPAMGEWLEVGALAARADYLVVLGGSAETRAVGAAAMYRAGLAQHVLISESVLHFSARDGILPSEADLTRRVLVARGVPDAAVLSLGRENDNTYDEIRALGAFLEQTPHVTAAIVTSDFHTRRTQWTAQMVLGANRARVQVVSVPNDNCPLSVWWRTDRGFIMVISEYVKFALYLVRYSRSTQIGLGLAAGLVVAAVVLRYRRAKTAAQASPTVPRRPVGLK